MQPDIEKQLEILIEIRNGLAEMNKSLEQLLKVDCEDDECPS